MDEFQELAATIESERPDQLVLFYAELLKRRSELQTDPVLAHQDLAGAIFLDTFMMCGIEDFLAFKTSDRLDDPLAPWRSEPIETFEHFWASASTFSNPVLRALFMSGLWELRTVITPLKSPTLKPIAAARAAVEAHVVAAEWMRGKNIIDALTRTASVAQHWKTALIIAGQVGATALLSSRIDSLRACLTTAVIDAPHWAITLVECELTLAAPKGVRNAVDVSDERLATLASIVDDIAQHLSNSMMIHLEENAIEVRARIEELLGNRPTHQELSRRRAVLLEGRIRRTESGIMRSLYWKSAASEYQQAGLRDDANRAKSEARNALQDAEQRGEFQLVSVPLIVTPEQLDTLSDNFFQDISTPRDVLARVGTRLFVPSLEQAGRPSTRRRSIVSQIAVTVPVVDDRTLAEIAPDTEEQEQHEQRRALITEMNISTLLISRILERLRLEHHLHWDDLYAVLACGSTVEPQDLPFLSRAAERYLAGDTISLIHVLVPRIEQMIRRMLRAAGVAITALRDGELRERPLGELLREAAGDGALPAGCIVLLQNLLSEDSGINLRNRVAHGWLTPLECSQQMADRVLHTALYLACLRSEPVAEDAPA